MITWVRFFEEPEPSNASDMLATRNGQNKDALSVSQVSRLVPDVCLSSPKSQPPGEADTLFGETWIQPKPVGLKERLQAQATKSLVQPEEHATTDLELEHGQGPASVPVRIATPESLKAQQSNSIKVSGPLRATLGTTHRKTILPRRDDSGESPALVLQQDERYRELRPLGEGAMGEVVLAQDNDIQRKVAIKKLKPKHHNATSLLRFVEEIQTVGQLDHPGIVPIHDVGVDDDGQLFFVMKYAEGETMDVIIRKLKEGDAMYHARFPFEVRNQIFAKLLQTIQYAHSCGWVHRDLKPANIMVGHFGEVVVMDWGLVKKLERRQKSVKDGRSPLFRSMGKPELEETITLLDDLLETQQNILLGTPAYMAPEQAMGNNHALDERSDVYSLSVLYYEWIGLEHYMAHKSSLRDMLFGVVHEEPALLIHQKSLYQPSIPVEYCHFVRKGMSKAPEDRFQSAEEMTQHLQDMMAGQFPIQCPVTLTKRLTNETLRFTDRHPFLMIAAVVSIVTLAAFGGGYLAYALIASMLA